MANVLIIGAGDVGLKFAEGLLRQGGATRLTLADAKPAAARATVEMMASCHEVGPRLVELDGSDPRAVTRLLQETHADLVVQAASPVGPWAIIGRDHPTARALTSAGIGIQLPAQLIVLTTVMTCLRELGHEGPVANVSVPDLSHPILATRGLAPTIGLGNASMMHLRARAAFRDRLEREGKPPSAAPLLRVLGHHAQVYGVMQSRQPEDPALSARVYLGEAGDRDDALAYQGPTFAPGPLYNVLTAASALPILGALLPGAAPLRFSAPAPLGLPGGYPVRIEGGRVSLDLPPGVGPAEAEAFNNRLTAQDGVEAIEADGTVHFTEAAQAAVAGLDPRLAAPLRLDDLSERAGLLCEVVAGIP